MTPASADTATSLAVRWLGRTRYAEAHRLQLELVEARAAGDLPDTVLLLDHAPVLTAGRSSTQADLAEGRALAAAAGLDFAECERGGRLTYHGPGQLVAYPIVHLDCCGRDLHRWLWTLEEATIRCLATMGVEARRDPAGRGVWTRRGKLASVGVAVRHWVSYHGVSLNLGPVGLPAGGRFCGMSAAAYTDLAAQGTKAEPQAVGGVLALELSKLCGLTLVFVQEGSAPEALAAPGSR